MRATPFRAALFRRLSSYVTSRNLGPKLFLSHLVVALAGTFTFAAVFLLTPALLGGVAGRMTGPELPLTTGGVLAAGLAATAAAAAASLFVAGRIAEPVRHMLAATRRVSAGRYAERVPVVEDDELGSLSEGFNAMAAALEDGERRRREFVADVSHELKTPLATLEGYVEGLIDGVVEPAEDTWALMHAEAERMRRLVDDLQRLSRAEAGKLALELAPVSPAQVVRLAAEGMSPLFSEKGVALEVAVARDEPPALADRDRVVQVLANLLSNALRHTPAGGRVVAGAEARGREVCFRVADTGSGVAPEHLDRLFDRFYRVEKSRSREGGGSGLGLAISRALVEAMGGEIRAESPGPGGGTTFVFALPVARAAQRS